jgi:hypothetical protein
MMSTLESRIDACAAALRAYAKEAGMSVSGDGRVFEADAAKLLGFESERSLSQLRAEGKAPPAYKPFGRWTYRIHDLAERIERHRLDADT